MIEQQLIDIARILDITGIVSFGTFIIIFLIRCFLRGLGIVHEHLIDQPRTNYY